MRRMPCLIEAMKTRSKLFLLAPAWPMPLPDPPSLKPTHNLTDIGLMPQRTPSEEFFSLQNKASACAPEIAEPPAIYVVDDEPLLTELYTIFLEAAGYFVKAFTDRVEALAALAGERRKPDLLVTDYFGSSMLADGFMRRCLKVHPHLRILIASNLSQRDVHFFSVRPNRFIQKPFNAEEFLREVKAALVADPGDSL